MSLFASRGVPRRPDPEPLRTDDVRLVGAGTLLWALALVVLAVLRLVGVEQVRGWWMAMCVFGILLGLIGIRYVQGQRRRTRQQG